MFSLREHEFFGQDFLPKGSFLTSPECKYNALKIERKLRTKEWGSEMLGQGKRQGECKGLFIVKLPFFS